MVISKNAMIIDPKLLVWDEPVSALDVSIQTQIINLLMDLKEQTQMSMIFISHNLSIARQICDRILVLYNGEIVEMGKAEDIYQNPQHEYTKKMLDSIPLADPERERNRILKGWKVGKSKGVSLSLPHSQSLLSLKVDSPVVLHYSF